MTKFKKHKIKSLKEILLSNDAEISCPVIIDGINTGYFITSHGRLYKVTNNIMRYIKYAVDAGGYCRYTLYYVDSDYNYNKVTISAHRAVAYAFIPNPKPDKYTEVNHIDGTDKTNNHVYNLEWCDRSMNMHHAYDTNLHRQGSKSPLSIYEEKQIRKVCELLQDNKETLTDISFITGVGLYTINAIKSHKKWKSISKEYDIDKYCVKAKNTGSIAKYSDTTIHQVCKMLSEKELSMREISAICNVGFNTVADIKRHRTWTRISNQYAF